MATTIPHVRGSASGAPARARLFFILDGFLLFAALTLESPRGSGLFAHEWLAAVFSAALAAHLLLNWQWIRQTLRKILLPGAARARANAFLNATLFVCMTFTIFSGIKISEVVLPLAGLQPSPLLPWHKVHKLFAALTIAVVGLHLGLNWDWLVAVIRTRALTRTRSGGTSGSVSAAPTWLRFTTAFRRLALVIAAFAFVSAACVGLVRSTGIPRSQPARRNRFAQAPQPGVVPREIGVQLLVVAAAAVLSRKVLRLRL